MILPYDGGIFVSSTLFFLDLKLSGFQYSISYSATIQYNTTVKWSRNEVNDCFYHHTLCLPALHS